MAAQMKSKLPKTEFLWKTDHTPSGTFYTTSDKSRTKYTLWRQDAEGVTKIKSAATPEKFNEILQPLWSAEFDEKPKRKRRNAT